MPQKTPLQVVNDVHGGKEKLVDNLVGMIDRGEEPKDDFRTRLLAAPNSKLLRLHRTMTEINQQFGNVDKMVDSLLELMKKSKDNDYREKLVTRTPVQLLALHREWERRGRKAQARARA